MILCEARRPPMRSNSIPLKLPFAELDRRSAGHTHFDGLNQERLVREPCSQQLQEAMQAVFRRTHDRPMNREERVQFGISKRP